MILLACCLFTFAILVYVFYLPGEVAGGPAKDRLGFLRERKEVLYENLRDLNFENKAGKLSAGDYESLRESLEQEGARILAEIAELERAQAGRLGKQ
jgi:hypothetical protein